MSGGGPSGLRRNDAVERSADAFVRLTTRRPAEFTIELR